MVPGDWGHFHVGGYLWRQSGTGSALLHVSFSQKGTTVSTFFEHILLIFRQKHMNHLQYVYVYCMQQPYSPEKIVTFALQCYLAEFSRTMSYSLSILPHRNGCLCILQHL